MTALSKLESKRLHKLEKQIREGARQFVAVGLALLEIRDGRLYREDYDTFEAYCRERWKFTRQYGNHLIAASQVATALETTVSTLADVRSVAEASGKTIPQYRDELADLTAAELADERRQAEDRRRERIERPGLPDLAMVLARIDKRYEQIGRDLLTFDGSERVAKLNDAARKAAQEDLAA